MAGGKLVSAASHQSQLEEMEAYFNTSKNNYTQEIISFCSYDNN